MSETSITERIEALRRTLPPGVLLVAAAKTRTTAEIRAAVDAGVTAVGHNYVQEAEAMCAELKQGPGPGPERVHWHLIGHLQHNKAARAAALFDMIETVDSLRLARALDRHCAALGKTMPILIEVNSGGEPGKAGVAPADVEALVRAVAALTHLRIRGLMTMGPATGEPEELRPFFRLTRNLFDTLAAAKLDKVAMQRLSMGMSNSYSVAVEEGANVVRIGTGIFGPHKPAPNAA